MDKSGEQPMKEMDAGRRHANKLPAEIVGRFLGKLSVGDRLKSERVSPLWKQALQKWGWTEQRKLDADIILEGANEQQIGRFWDNLVDGNCHLASLLHCSGPWLRELDLGSLLIWENTNGYLTQLVGILQSFKKLEKLDIGAHYLRDFVDHLPPTLRELKTSGKISVETFKALSDRCPNLEEVPFRHLENQNNLETDSLIELIGKFPRLKKLYLNGLPLRSEKIGALASIGQLKALEELHIWDCQCFDGESLEAIAGGCQQLRSLTFDARKLTERELFQLGEIKNLTILQVFDRNGEFSDTVLEKIAQRGQLKKLVLYYDFGSSRNEALTDASILYLIDRCKSLVSLFFFGCSRITERSLEAVVAEVQRRYGTEPVTFPTGDLDPGIFYFDSAGSWNRDYQPAADNPWMKFGFDLRENI